MNVGDELREAVAQFETGATRLGGVLLQLSDEYKHLNISEKILAAKYVISLLDSSERKISEPE